MMVSAPRTPRREQVLDMYMRTALLMSCCRRSLLTLARLHDHAGVVADQLIRRPSCDRRRAAAKYELRASAVCSKFATA